MKAKKLICLIMAMMGCAALFTACGEKEKDTLHGDDSTQQESNQGGSQDNQGSQSGSQQGGSQENQGSQSGSQQGGSQESQGSQSGSQGNQGGSQSGSQESQGSQGNQENEGSQTEKHEHKFTWKTTLNADCLHDGEEEGVCDCGEKTTRKIERLGHNFGEVRTDSDGSKYRVCTRCTYRDNLGDEIEFTVSIVIEEGSDFQIDEKTKILVYKNSSVYQIYDAKESITFTLPRGNYVVRADGFSNMYVQKGYYELSETVPSVEIVVGNNPEYDRQIDRHVDVGDKMFNFLVKDTTKDPEEYQRFYDLAEGKQLIFIDFFYVACNPCEYMLKEELEFYRTLDDATKEKFLMILIDKDNQDTATNINAHRERMGIPDEIITMQKGAQVYKNFENWGLVPHGGFLDENGVIIEITSGWDFKDMIQKHLQGGAQTTAVTAEEIFV